MFSDEVIDSFKGKHSFLSNFHVEPMIMPFFGTMIMVPTVEHSYQALKSKDTVEQLKILSAVGPGAAKRMGKQVKMMREDWETIKVPVMLNLLRIKFSIPSLKQLLLDTGDAKLIEGNWWGDKFWGVCNGEGRNMLGTLLMNLREELRNGDQHNA